MKCSLGHKWSKYKYIETLTIMVGKPDILK